MNVKSILTAVVVGVIAYFIWTKVLASKFGF